jgi:hypothetical protein
MFASATEDFVGTIGTSTETERHAALDSPPADFCTQSVEGRPGGVPLHSLPAPRCLHASSFLNWAVLVASGVCANSDTRGHKPSIKALQD